MPNAVLDDLDRTRFVWPEPLLIDLISDCYGFGTSIGDRIAAARQHTAFLRGLVEGERRRSAFPRLELIAFCAARGIGVDAIEEADQTVFRELVRIIDERFRNSPKLRKYFTLRLYEGRARLPPRTQWRSQAAAGRALPVERAPSIKPLARESRKQTLRG